MNNVQMVLRVSACRNEKILFFNYIYVKIEKKIIVLLNLNTSINNNNTNKNLSK